MRKQGLFSIRVVTTLEEFKALTDQWSGLIQRAASDNIFLRWEWLYAWAKHYLGDQTLWIILVYKGKDQLVGIAPFYIRRVKWYGVLNLREMLFLGTEGVSSSYLDFIVANRHRKAVLYHIYRHLHGEAHGLWDTLTLPEVPAESATIDLWDGFVKEAGKVMEVTGMTHCPVINLTDRLEDFMKEIGGNERYNLQRKRKRLERAGNITYQRCSSVQDVQKGMETFMRLHEMRWEQKGAGGVFRSHRFLMFHREIARVFAENGWVYLDFLLLNGEAIAGIYSYSYNGRYSFYLPGFNPTIVPKASPGILLLFYCIREAIGEGIKQFDLLRGPDDYKMAWANGIRRSLTLKHYNNHVRGAMVKLLDSLKSFAKVMVR